MTFDESAEEVGGSMLLRLGVSMSEARFPKAVSRSEPNQLHAPATRPLLSRCREGNDGEGNARVLQIHR
jgi:hypothetical protein